MKSYSPAAVVPVLRFLHPGISLTIRAIFKADEGVYYARGIGITTGEAYEVAR